MKQWPSDEFLELRPEPFQAHLFIETEPNFPSSITMAGLAGNEMKYVYLPGGTTLDKLPNVQKIARDVYAKREGGVALYGKIIGFIWVYSPTEAVRLDIEGNEVSRITGKFHPPSISIQNQR